MARRMRASWGCCQRLAKDKYRLRWPEDTPDGRKRRSETFRGTRREAERRLAEIRLSLDERRAPTVGELWERHESPALDDAVADDSLSDRTAKAYRDAWAATVGPRWAGVPCTAVRPRDVQDWLLTLTRSKGKLAKVVLSRTLDHAVMLDVVQANAAQRPYRMAPSAEKEKFAYTPAQLDRIWDAVRGSACEVPFLLCAHAGLRVGEACGMRLADVEWRDDCAVLSVTVQARQDGKVTERLKTRTSARVAAVAAPWSDRLREIADAQPEGAVYLNDSGLGEPVSRAAVGAAWERLVRPLEGVPYQPMKNLRPSFQTNLHWSGVPIERTARILGHSRPTTTLSYYDEPTRDQIARTVVGASCADGAPTVGGLGTN